jgi:hypothetical protein
MSTDSRCPKPGVPTNIVQFKYETPIFHRVHTPSHEASCLCHLRSPRPSPLVDVHRFSLPKAKSTHRHHAVQVQNSHISSRTHSIARSFMPLSPSQPSSFSIGGCPQVLAAQSQEYPLTTPFSHMFLYDMENPIVHLPVTIGPADVGRFQCQSRWPRYGLLGWAKIAVGKSGP